MLTATRLVFDAGGRVRCSLSAPTSVTGDTPTVGQLLAVVNDAPQQYRQGIGYRTTGQLAVDIGGTVAYYAQGLPFTSSDRLVTDEVGAITHHVAGIPRTAAGAVATAAPE